ncbi:MAG: hypothetical protein RO257_00515 [Candidatus Kapabacteria bacterium]|nr:hypothetical protein [Candidatus Kapabacteria bacterium]
MKDNMDRFISYLDGNLDEEEQISLFVDLAGDKELRTDFRAVNTLKAALPLSVNTFKPDAVQKSRLFTKAGFIIPVDSQVVAEIVKPEPISNSAFSGLFSNGILQAVIASIVTVFVMLYLLKNEGNNNSSESTKNIESISQNSKVNNNIPLSESYAVNTDNSKAESNAKPVVKYVYITKYIPVESIDQNPEENLSESPSNMNQEILKSEFDYKNDMSLKINDNNLLPKNNISDVDYYPVNINDISSLNNFEINFDQSIPWHIPEDRIEPESFSKLNNLSLKAFYRLNNFLRIGASIDQSTFYTEYEGTDEGGSLYRYRMQPNLTTYSGEMILNLFAHEKISPYFQLGIGGNTAGFVIKPSAGIEYRFIDNLSFYLCGSYDYFSFSHQDKRFNSQKFRIIYGISYKL